MSTRQANAMKRTRRCLRCGKPMWTDRCHRICPTCAHKNEGLLEVRVGMSQDLCHYLRALADDGWRAPHGVLRELVALTED